MIKLFLPILYNLLFMPSAVCRKSLVNRNIFRSFYEQNCEKCSKN